MKVTKEEIIKMFKVRDAIAKMVKKLLRSPHMIGHPYALKESTDEIEYYYDNGYELEDRRIKIDDLIKKYGDAK